MALCREYKNVEFLNYRSNNFPIKYNNQYDLAISNIVYHWVENQEKIESFARVFQSLKPGGVLAAAIPNRQARNVKLFLDAYCEKHPEVLSKIDHAVSSSLFFVSKEWLHEQLAKTGFIKILIDEDEEGHGLATEHDFGNWCIASYSKTCMAPFFTREAFEEVKGLPLQRMANGDIEVNYSTCLVRAEKGPLA